MILLCVRHEHLRNFNGIFHTLFPNVYFILDIQIQPQHLILHYNSLIHILAKFYLILRYVETISYEY